jgi:hypothetical protein
MTVPRGGAVVVPHGSTVVSHEDVNVDVDSREARSVDKHEIRAGHGKRKSEDEVRFLLQPLSAAADTSKRAQSTVDS